MASNINFEQMISCPICQEIYSEPYALSCLHTLCKCCIDKLQKYPKSGKAIECPICRDRTDLGLLKKDFRIQSLIDIINGQPTYSVDKQFARSSCQLCHKRDVTCQCFDCDKLICHECKESHQAIPLCSGHTIKSIHDLAKDGMVQVKRIADKLQFDKIHVDQKLQQIRSYSQHLDMVKTHAQKMIAESEKFFFECVRRRHQTMLNQVDRVVAKQRGQLEVHKCGFIECVCKLETASRCLNNVASQLTNVPSLVASLGILKEIDLDGDQLGEQILDIRYLDVNLYRHEIHGNSLDVELKIHTSEKPSDFEMKPTFIELDQLDRDDGNQATLDDVMCNNPCIVYPEDDMSLQYCDHLLMILDSIQNTAFNDHSKSWHSMSGNNESLGSASVQKQSNRKIKPIHLLSEIKRQQLQKCGEIHIEKLDCPVKIKIIADEIWCLCKSKVEIFDLAGCPTRTLKHKNIQNARSLTKAHNGDVFIASETDGLVHVNSHKPFHCIFPGNFCDVTKDLETLYALEYKKCSIILFRNDARNSRRQLGSTCQSQWSVFFEIPRPDMPSLDDTLLVKDGTIVVGSYKGDCILFFNQEGKYLASEGKSGKNLGELWRPRLCCVDKEGTLLVSDFYNNRMQILDNSHVWHSVEILESLNFPWDGLLHPRTGLLVLQNCNIHNKILRFGKV